MELIGQCAICGKPALNTCAICGNLVCDEHYYPRAKMCSRCMPSIERTDEKNRRERRDLYG